MSSNLTDWLRLTAGVLLAAACGDGTGPGSGPSEQVVFLSARTGRSQIYLMNADGSNKTVISADTSANYDRLEVSRSTGRVLFTKFGGVEPTGV